MLANTVCKLSPYQVPCSYRLWVDFSLISPLHWRWFAFVRHSALRCAIFCHNWLADALSSIFSRRKQSNGHNKCTTTRTIFWVIYCSCVWHHFCRIGSLIWSRRLSVCHCIRLQLEHFSVKCFAILWNTFGYFLFFFVCPGVAPPSFLAIQAGKTLNTMTSSKEAFSWTSVLLLGFLSIFTVAPIIFKKQLKKKIE